MAIGSARQQDSFRVSPGGDASSVLLPLTHLAFRVKKQIKRKLMAGLLAPEDSQNAHAIAACKPVIRHGVQSIHVGLWLLCPWRVIQTGESGPLGWPQQSQRR